VAIVWSSLVPGAQAVPVRAGRGDFGKTMGLTHILMELYKVY
jgi:hypothetical protein